MQIRNLPRVFVPQKEGGEREEITTTQIPMKVQLKTPQATLDID